MNTPEHAQEAIESIRRELAARKERFERESALLAEQFEADTAVIQARLGNAQERFNALVAVARLPTEVLAEVFRLYLAEFWEYSGVYHNTYYDEVYLASSRPWACLMHVCRRWRDVALGAPSLWTTLAPDNERTTRRVVSSSGCLPLTVMRTAETWQAPPFLFVFAQLHRIRKLDFTCTTDMLNALKGHFEDLEAPLLQELSVDLKSVVDSFPSLSKAALPRLTALSLDGFARGEAASGLAFIRTLVRPTVTRLSLKSLAKLNVTILKDILEPLIFLTHLTLKNVGSESQGRQITLPLLQQLHIDDHSEVAACLLDHIAIPPTASFSVKSAIHRADSSLSSAVARKMDILQAQDPTLRAQHIHIAFNESNRLDYDCKFSWNPPSENDDATAITTCSFTVPTYRTLEYGAWPPDDLIASFFQTVDLSQVTTMRTDVAIGPHAWVSTLHGMTSLRELTVADIWLGGLVDPSCVEINPFLPSLKTIHVNFANSTAPPPSGKSPMRSLLPVMLNRRRKNGYRLERLKISRSDYLTPSAMTYIRKLKGPEHIEID